MTGFMIFGLYVLACWLAIQLGAKPLQPDQFQDDLGDVDVDSREFQAALKQQTWWESPQVNLVLSRRRGRG